MAVGLTRSPQMRGVGNKLQEETLETPEVVEETVETDETPDETPEEKAFTQADVDRIVAKRLKRQETEFSKKYADYDQKAADAEAFRKIQDEKATDSERWEKERERLNAQLQEQTEQLTKLQRANLIADLATERGLPKSMWKRIQGNSEEELAEDIDALVADLNGTEPGEGSSKKTPAAPKKKAAPLHGGGGETEDPDPDIAQIVAGIPRGPQLRVEKPRTFK